MEEIGFWFGLILAALLLMVGHWLPWPRRLPRLAAYACGVASLLVGQAVWLGLAGRWETWWRLMGFAVTGGLATGLCWGVDWLLNLIARQRIEHGRADDDAG